MLLPRRNKFAACAKEVSSKAPGQACAGGAHAYTLVRTKRATASVLNRIYIIVGVLAILVLAGAFIAPRIIDWSDYRDRMEALSSQVLGTDVVIRGEIEFSLLPQPRLRFTDVLVGAPDKPAATVGAVEADFSLIEFLRDDYNVTRLMLSQPVIDLSVDESGLFGSGFAIAADNDSRISLSSATIVGGTIRLADVRAGQNFIANDVDGEVKLGSLAGPFQFQGGLAHDGVRYSVRFNSSAVDAEGASRVAGAVAAVERGFSLSAEGQLLNGIAPKFDGTVTYRQAPPVAEAADDIRGDLVLEANVQASTDRIVFTGYTLQPDENRAGTRLTGAASIQLGARRNFDAVISGGVFALPPRDANEDQATQAYEIVRLLSELPAPIIPPLAGRIGVDLAEVGLRGFALRNVRMDARSDGQVWTIEQFVARLPGDAELRASGTLSAEGDKPAFSGQASLSTQRLDALAQLWRKPGENDPLFGVPASLEARVMLAGDALGLNNGRFILDETTHSLELRLGFGTEKRLDLVGHFADLGATRSQIMSALLPQITAGPAFGITFPNGSFSLSGEGAQILGQAGRGLVAEGQWSPGRISFTRLAAQDLGGIRLDAALAASGTLVMPTISGSGTFGANAGSALALLALYEAGGVPEAWRDAIGRSLPGDVAFNLDAPDAAGAQGLSLSGRLGAADLDLRAQLSAGLVQAPTAPLQLNGTLETDDPVALAAQLGLGETDLFAGADAAMVAVNLDGALGQNLATQITASAGDDSISFAGTLVQGTTGELTGDGTLDARLAEASGLASVLGADGVSLPTVSGSAAVHFEGARLARFDNIAGQSGDIGFSGQLSLTRSGGGSLVDGQMHIASVDVTGLAASLFGPAALIPGDGAWPDGPFDIGARARTSRGSVAITTDAVTAGGQTRMTKAKFDLSWDETRSRLARFEASIGLGRVTADLAVCCASALTDKTLSGRVTLTGVALDDIAPPAIGANLDSVIDGGMQVEGTGASIAAALDVLTGEGNFTIASFAAQRLDPKVFSTVAALDNVLEMDADGLGAIMGMALGQGDFVAPVVNGAFTIAGGVVRLANLIVESDTGRLAGGADIRLHDLGLSGNFALTPVGFTDAASVVSDGTGLIATDLSGTLTEPVITLDLGTMIAAIQVRANEIEVDRLEALRVEDAARQRAAAEERNRLIEEQRQRAAAEAAARAAEEEARRAEEAEALRQQLLLQQQQAPAPTAPVAPVFSAPLDLGMPPAASAPASPPIGNGSTIVPLNQMFQGQAPQTP